MANNDSRFYIVILNQNKYKKRIYSLETINRPLDPELK